MKSKRLRNPALQLLFWEGAAAMAYETWVGPTYLSGLAGAFGVSVGVVSLLVSAPAIGSVGQLIGVWALDRAHSDKAHTMRWVIAARSLWLIPLVLAVVFVLSTNPFPRRFWFLSLAMVTCAVSVLATSSASAWLAWVKGLVPGRFFGRFFAIRYRYVTAATIAANLIAAALLGWEWRGYSTGYFAVGLAAVMSAGISTFLLAKVPQAKQSLRVKRGFSEILVAPWKDREFRKLLIFGALFNGALQVAGPYFPYYFTSELGIPMNHVALWIGIAALGCFVSSPFWGHRIDSPRGARPSLHFCTFLMAISPLFYTFGSSSPIYWVAPGEYFINGFVSAGYLLALTALQLRAAPPSQSGVYFSVYTAMAGITGAAANIVGGKMAVLLGHWGGFRALWVVCSILRMGVAVWGVYFLRSTKTEGPTKAVPALRGLESH